MKLLCIFSWFFLLSEVQIVHAQRADLSRLAEQKRYTDLQKRLEREKAGTTTWAIYQSILLNVFSKPAASNKMISSLLKDSARFSDSTRFMLLATQNDNFVKLFNYPKAYETKQQLMDQYASFYPKEQIEGEMQTLHLLNALKDELPQITSHQGNASLPITRNFLGLQKIPVGVNGLCYSFIFDTGAGISTVTDSMAVVLQLRIIDKIPIVIRGGITGLGTNIRLGIADKISIGNIEMQQVVFLVFPDSALTINVEEKRIKIDAIIGFPVIKELGSITVYKDSLLVNAVGNKPEGRPNMAIDFLKPVLFLNYEGADLPFTFDTGADQTVLSEVFYKRYRMMVNKKGVARTESYGGSGGIKDFKVMVLPSVQFTNFGNTLTLKKISVSTEKIDNGADVYYGNIGQDLIKQYRSMTIDFLRSQIKFNN